MSAFMVDKTHIDAMLTAGIVLAYGQSPVRWFNPDIEASDGLQECQVKRRELRVETADATGAMLLAENQRSVNYRYSEFDIEELYRFRMLQGYPDPLDILGALGTYEYQACEHPEWRISEAYRFCLSLRHVCIRRLPGFDETPGEITDPEFFQVRLAQQAAKRQRAAKRG